jgi:hypothetical protein
MKYTEVNHIKHYILAQAFFSPEINFEKLLTAVFFMERDREKRNLNNQFHICFI